MKHRLTRFALAAGVVAAVAAPAAPAANAMTCSQAAADVCATIAFVCQRLQSHQFDTPVCHLK
jgi:hypothetical protein